MGSGASSWTAAPANTSNYGRMPKTLSKWDKRQLAQIAAIKTKVAAAYDEMCKRAGTIGALYGGTVNPDKEFRWTDYPTIEKMVDEELAVLADNVRAVIINGSRAQWSLANEKNDALCEQVFGLPYDRLPESVQRRYFTTNEAALEAFLKRKDNGLGLSQRVWRDVRSAKVDIESALELGIKSGQSASQMASDLKQYLKEPDKLYRRVRDKEGVLHLSSRAREYHPGQGVYRSSYKNALRLAATECNMAYRTADYERVQDFDFVVGIEVRLSNNHTLNGRPFTDICDDLAGRYPKDFKFTGWHPFCRCHTVTILKTHEEIMEDNRRILAGREPSETSVNSVIEMPAGFKQWTEDNKDRILAADKRGTLPYFIRDNATTVATLADSPLRSLGVKPETVAVTTATSKRTDELDALADALGIERGKPMSFEDANKMHGNPHYAEDEAYRVNCQTCVVAHELRRRGLDLEALPNTKGSALERLSRHTESAWLDANGNTPKSTRISTTRTLDRLGRVRTSINWSELGEATKEPGRYHIAWGWVGKEKGHIVTFERFEDGKFRWYDPQNGKTAFFTKDYMAKIYNVKVLRVDNLRINPDVTKEVLVRSGEKARIGGVASSGEIAGKLRTISKKECNYTLPNGGSVSTPKARLAKGNYNKQEQAKFEKELRMAKRFASGGHKIEFVANDVSSFDVLIDGIKADFKSTSSPGNIVKYAKHATRKQGADLVLFECSSWGTPYIEAIDKLKRMGIHGKYLLPGDSTIYSF